MLHEEAGDVELHMASYRFCHRLCFFGLITFSLCSVVFIMSRGKHGERILLLRGIYFPRSINIINLAWKIIVKTPCVEMIAY